MPPVSLGGGRFLLAAGWKKAELDDFFGVSPESPVPLSSGSGCLPARDLFKYSIPFLRKTMAGAVGQAGAHLLA
jgi:hypothetical protein